jgi:hypothetical protein
MLHEPKSEYGNLCKFAKMGVAIQRKIKIILERVSFKKVKFTCPNSFRKAQLKRKYFH